MFHHAIELKFNKETNLTLTFQDGTVRSFDMKNLFSKYPKMRDLENRDLFLSGKLMPGGLGIIWNDDLDIETETIYQEGMLVGTNNLSGNIDVAKALLSARAAAGLSQKELSERTGIDQSDISKIERGISNPSVLTLKKLAKGLNADLEITFSLKHPA